MKKSIAFLVLMFASQVALGDFLWPRGNEFKAQIQNIEIYIDGEFDAMETSEARGELLGKSVNVFINTQRTLVRIDELDGKDPTVCVKKFDYFECAAGDLNTELKLRLRINLKRLVGMEATFDGVDWQGRSVKGSLELLVPQ